MAPKDQKKVWKEAKKRLKYAIYHRKLNYFKTYISGIFRYYDIATNMTWLISRVHWYLIKLSGRKRRYKNRIRRDKNECVVFYIDNELLDLWGLRKSSVNSTKEYMINVHKYWDPNNSENFSPISWIEEFYNRREGYINRNSGNLIHVPSIIKQYKKEPITRMPYYSCSPSELEIHHKVPINRGGTDEYNNLILLRKECHKLIHKENLTREEIPKYMLVKEINKFRKQCGLKTV